MDFRVLCGESERLRYGGEGAQESLI
ncbi:hypothetical protein NC652_004810 [Populus alba x Populus x berolinensis]|nr:hypothetical protein NC652_004810 [Populus alba x Populus x berolinensis]